MSPLISPEILYFIYVAAFPFISYYLFEIVHKHHKKERTTTLLCFGILSAILYSWLYVLGPRVYVFVYPVLCVSGIVPLLKLLALEMNALEPSMVTHVRSSFFNYYVYLVAPSEVFFHFHLLSKFQPNILLARILT